jgi:hypothetical protein
MGPPEIYFETESIELGSNRAKIKADSNKFPG